MLRLVAILAGALLLALGAWFTFRTTRQVVPTQEVSGEALQKNFPPDIVFGRVLWRQPSPDDRILHALRREWSDQQGVTRWQAFLAIEPGPALRDWLATNPFSLASVVSATREIPNPPSWFPKKLGGFMIQQAPLANMLIFTAPGGSPVYLTDHGQGFARPAAKPAPLDLPTASSNRLPNTPPPITNNADL